MRHAASLGECWSALLEVGTERRRWDAYGDGFPLLRVLESMYSSGEFVAVWFLEFLPVVILDERKR